MNSILIITLQYLIRYPFHRAQHSIDPLQSWLILSRYRIPSLKIYPGSPELHNICIFCSQTSHFSKKMLGLGLWCSFQNTCCIFSYNLCKQPADLSRGRKSHFCRKSFLLATFYCMYIIMFSIEKGLISSINIKKHVWNLHTLLVTFPDHLEN